MPPQQVLVYRYKYWDETRKEHVVSSDYATILAIRDGLGLPLFETAAWVDANQLQGGIYRPRGTLPAPKPEGPASK